MPKKVDFESRFQAVLGAMQELQQKQGYWPSTRELAYQLDWGHGLVLDTVRRMAKQGWLEQAQGHAAGQSPKRSRGYRPAGEIVKPGKTTCSQPRLAVLQYIAQRNGCTVAEIADGLGYSYSRARYYVTRLRMEGLLGSSAGKHRAIHPQRAVVMGIQRLDWRKMWVPETLAAVKAAPGSNNRQLADRLGMAVRTMRLRMWKLEQAGLVRVERRGKGQRRHYYPVNPAAEA